MSAPVSRCKKCYKEIAHALMTLEGRETVVANDGGKSKVFLLYRCPKPECTKGVVMFQKGFGFKNARRHLRTFYRYGNSTFEQEKHLKCRFEDVCKIVAKEGGTIFLRFKSTSMSEDNKLLYGWVRKVFLCNTPLSHVENDEERKWYRYDVPVSVKAVVETMLSLVQLVEDSIGHEMKETRGALLFDGWT